MKFAYADPPYYGQGRKLYQHPEWDSLDFYKLFIEQLSARYDGWALSASSTTLRDLLPFCPPEVRVGAWTKPFAIFKPNVNPAYAWEPVLFVGGRKRTREQATVRDWVSCNITLRKGLTGAKPEEVCAWIIDLLGAEPDDTFDDLMPGTGVFGWTWAAYCAANKKRPRREAGPVGGRIDARDSGHPLLTHPPAACKPPRVASSLDDGLQPPATTWARG